MGHRGDMQCVNLSSGRQNRPSHDLIGNLRDLRRIWKQWNPSQDATGLYRQAKLKRPFFQGLSYFKAREFWVCSKRVSHGELRFLARKEPVNQLTQKAESDRSRLFALNPWISRVCDDSDPKARVLVSRNLLSGSRSQP